MGKIFFFAITCLFILAGCSQVSNTPSSVKSEPTAVQSNEPEKNNANVQSFSLIFKSVELENPLTKISSTELKNIILEKQINDYKVFIYQKASDTENVFAAIQSGSNIFEIGQIGYAPVQKANDYSVNQVKALNNKYIKVTGSCGANCPISEYIQMNRDIPTLVRFDAHTQEADMNQDGINEIVATVGTAAETSIYKLENNHIVTVNLNETMNAQVVTYNHETNTFQADIPKGTTSNWKVNDDKISRVP